jgi:hypothetical protein
VRRSPAVSRGEGTARQQSLNLPVRLLEASMNAERERDPERSALTAERIKTAGNASLPTVVGCARSPTT